MCQAAACCFIAWDVWCLDIKVLWNLFIFPRRCSFCSTLLSSPAGMLRAPLIFCGCKWKHEGEGKKKEGEKKNNTTKVCERCRWCHMRTTAGGGRLRRVGSVESFLGGMQAGRFNQHALNIQRQSGWSRIIPSISHFFVFGSSTEAEFWKYVGLQTAE